MGRENKLDDMRVRELASLTETLFEGDGDREIFSCAALEEAQPDQLSFVGNARAAKMFAESSAGCLIVPLDLDVPNRTVLRAPVPRATFAIALAQLHPEPVPEAGIHPTAIVDRTAEVHPRASVGPYCVIGALVQVAEDVRLANHVTLHRGVRIGARSILHTGVVVGADGFGFTRVGDGYEKFPQVGGVEIGADVEIGANTTIDRAALGMTRIGDGTKLDNLVHVGHTVTIGKHVVIAAQTGIAGGSTIGDFAVIGGQVGIADKVRIEAHSILGAQCGVPSGKLIRAGEPVWGTPARPIKRYLRDQAEVTRLADLRREVAALREALRERS